MGQSAIFTESHRRIDGDQCVWRAELQLSIFLTDLGWFGLYGREGEIAGLTIGHVSSDGVREAVACGRSSSAGNDVAAPVEADWLPDVRRLLERYAAGEPVDFSECRLEPLQRTPFQQRVLDLTRSIPYGATMTYGELAAKAGTPRAARAVGSVMASNRVPILIPCHRIVAAGSKLGGFSAPSGVRLKERMLALEAQLEKSKNTLKCQ